MYSTSEVADLLGVNRSNVNYYIRKGYLKAEVVDGAYKIKREDYISFRDKYFDTNIRFSSRGPAKKLSSEQIETLSKILTDLHDFSVSFENFAERYKNCNLTNFSDFLKYKRDEMIRYECNVKGYRHKFLAQKYGLSTSQIYRIIHERDEKNS